jgi:hypothetical protein
MTGFETPNYTQVPNALFAMMADMGESELKVVLCAVRLIFGYHKEKPEAISYSQFEKITGLNRGAVAKGVKDAIKRGVLRIAGNGKRGVNLYQIVIKATDNQFAEQTTDQFAKQTSQDDTSLQIKPMTGLQIKHTKESSKENKEIADGKVIPMPTANVSDGQEPTKKSRSTKQEQNDLMVDTLGKAFGAIAQGNDYGLYAKVGNTLLKAGIPMDEFPQYVKRLRIKATQQKWDLTIPSLIAGGRPSEYVASRDKYRSSQNAIPQAGLTEAELHNLWMITGQRNEAS